MPGGVFSAPEHLPPPLKPVKKPQADIDKSCERLSTPRKEARAHDDHLLAKTVSKPMSELEPSIQRLYQQALDKKKRQQEQHAAKEEEDLRKTAVVKSEDEVMEGVNRLYARAMEQHKHATDKLREKYLFTPRASPRRHIADSNDRLYKGAVEKQKARDEKLHERYVAHSLPPVKKITPAQVAASAERLGTKGPK
uniref:Uncharacterized protein n=1 Tax=Neobodo designis TaxID=312471 RepID=A0A7S1M2M8_NEODS|mmetsp:Transcript_31617/g.97712  ORF Transcript_31617/g.97712 Transcript_31617/m.97712 type:complete len:195 (+) Transcript_31617:86-670(+)